MKKLKDILIEAPGVRVNPKEPDAPIVTAEDIKKRLKKNIKLAIDQTNVYLKLLQSIQQEADMAGITADMGGQTLNAGVKIVPKEYDPMKKLQLDYRTDQALVDLAKKHNEVVAEMKELRSKIGDPNLFKF